MAFDVDLIIFRLWFSCRVLSTYGGIRGRCSDGTALNTGYETSDTVCIMLPRQKIFKRRQTDFHMLKQITFEEPDRKKPLKVFSNGGGSIRAGVAVCQLF